MGITRIKANIDQNVIYGEYIRQIAIGESIDPVDLTVKLIHQFVTQQDTVNEIELAQFDVPASYLTTTNGIFGQDTFDQKGIINIANTYYLNDLFLEVLEVRETVPIVTRVKILEVPLDVNDITPQPVKYDEFEENIPKETVSKPKDNISVPEPIVTPFIYTLEHDGLKMIQSSKRVFLVQGETAEEDVFLAQNYNEEIDVIYIENSTTNFLPNPQFVTDPIDCKLPEGYYIESPGIVVVSGFYEGQIEGTQEFVIRASNTDIFGAFNNVIFAMSGSADLQPGILSLTISSYYKLTADTGNLPFTQININVFFHNDEDSIISEKIITLPATQTDRWAILHGSVDGSEIPANAVRFSFEIELPDIDSADRFQLVLYLPQAEAHTYYTTRALANRIHDKYTTIKELELNLPLYIQLKTTHITGPGRRGLLSTTTNLKDGFQFLSASNRLRFIYFDVNGAAVFNIGSDIFNVDEGEIVTYGLYLDGSVVEFYVNSTLLSSHSQTYTIDQLIAPIVGSLEASNTGIQSEILDFKLLRNKP